MTKCCPARAGPADSASRARGLDGGSGTGAGRGAGAGAGRGAGPGPSGLRQRRASGVCVKTHSSGEERVLTDLYFD